MDKFVAEQLVALGDPRGLELLPALEESGKRHAEEAIAKATLFASDCPYWEKGFCKVREMVHGDLTKRFEKCSLVMPQDERDAMIGVRAVGAYRRCHVWNLYPR